MTLHTSIHKCGLCRCVTRHCPPSAAAWSHKDPEQRNGCNVAYEGVLGGESTAGGVRQKQRLFLSASIDLHVSCQLQQELCGKLQKLKDLKRVQDPKAFGKHSAPLCLPIAAGVITRVSKAWQDVRDSGMPPI